MACAEDGHKRVAQKKKIKVDSQRRQEHVKPIRVVVVVVVETL